MDPPDRISPDRNSLVAFEQLCHEVSNPLMIISGHTYLLVKEIRRLPHLPEPECERLIADLISIAEAVTTMASQLDAYRETLADSADNR